MGDYKDRGVTIPKLVQDVVNGVSRLKIDPCCWLVEKQQLGLSDQRNSDVDTPLQAA